MEEKFIHIKNAEVNNLKGIDVDIPRNKITVITGISGSGKTSLAFDTLFAEGQRRFAESLSSFARQFIGRMSKPAVQDISGIPPAIAIEQKVNTRNPRSTVGSTTEIYDYLRILFARIGHTVSPVTDEEITCDTPASVLEYCIKNASGLKENDEKILHILADVKWEEREFRIERLINLKEDGFTRLYFIDNATGKGKVEKIDDVLPQIGKYENMTGMLLIARLPYQQNYFEDEDNIAGLSDSLRSAFEAGNGHVSCAIESVGKGVKIKNFSSFFEENGTAFERPAEWMFNYNNPIGACPVCGGLGSIVGIDESLVIPNKALSVYQDAIACWKGEVMKFFKEQVIFNAGKYDFPIHTPYKELTEDQKRLLWEGNEDITGINPFFRELELKKYKIQNKYMIYRYSGKTVCPECGGSRLRREALYVKLGGKDIHQLTSMSVKRLIEFFHDLKLSDYEKKIASRAIREINQRLDYMDKVGLSYLTLSRASKTLSGGESQRINLVCSLGNSLTGSMYILDEPSIGLHERDTGRLISVLKSLRDLGNTVIVVEHDEKIIRSADYLIDIGPLAGRHGGEVVYHGAPPKTGLSGEEANALLEENPRSLTLQYLLGKKKMEINSARRHWRYSITICDACENNLKHIDAEFPLNVMTAVTGVSGSGKSTLVGDILYPALSRHINQFGPRPGSFKGLKGNLEKISAVEYIDQNPIGKSSRSNPATYIKVYDDIRKLFSEQPYAKMNGYGHSHFSFNIDGGRCPECLGEGTIKIPMQFMADIVMTCESCGGKRFKPDILEVKYKGKNISDILDMSVDEAIEFFSSCKEAAADRIALKLQPLHDVGLGYIALGQNSSTLSGGESQRVKLAYFLGKSSSEEKSFAGKQILFIFDEPTTGLHFDDIKKLLKSFDALMERGHTIIVVEHNPYIIAAADNIIELGPEGGDEGGYLLRNLAQETKIRF